MKLLEGKIALITGASRGIGRGIAKAFAAQGAAVAFTYLSSVEKGQALEAELAGEGIRAKGYRSDASDFEQAQALVDEVIKDFGRIDILVNNAGITRDGLLMRMSKDQWDAVIHANLDSVFNLTKGVQRYMLKQRSGSIINMSSVVGIKGNAGQANYAASKAGMIALAKSIAQELGSRGIRANAIAPGFFLTEQNRTLLTNPDGSLTDRSKTILAHTPFNRFGEPEDLYGTIHYLISDASNFVTGTVAVIDGGFDAFSI